MKNGMKNGRAKMKLKMELKIGLKMERRKYSKAVASARLVGLALINAWRTSSNARASLSASLSATGFHWKFLPLSVHDV